MAESNYWSTNGDQGMIKISEDVIASIAALSASETEGVSSLTAGISADIAGFLGKKQLSKGVKVQLEGDSVAMDICVTALYGSNIRDVAKEVQTNVKTSIESMTGLAVSAVDVHVAGVTFAPPAAEEGDTPVSTELH